MEKFNTLDPFLKTLWFIAVPVSVIFLVQLYIIISGKNKGSYHKFYIPGNLFGYNEGDGFQLLTSRNLVNFLFAFSWSGVLIFDYIDNIIILLSVAALVGASFVGLYYLIVKSLHLL